ncbi:MAG: Rpn family recombination-promoting nuclease/putative transposase [Bacteroidales bacterium]|nr:Rpn family recombination-promoting nuclease/putative transposase [Bacteroidales bacterium]
MAKESYIRFDWAAKRLLRQKSNFVVLEGFLSTLLKEKVKIVRMLESESNKESVHDKFNRVDMLAENSKGELVIVEIQNTRELNYFHRMLFGVSKVITEYIHEKDAYSHVRKVYSINIIYFDLGQGKDYVYHGKTEFIGIHNNDTLKLSTRQQKQFMYKEVGDLFPEYYILRVDGFDQKAVDPLDEWISFLKTSEIPDTAKAPGLPEARELLRRDTMSKEERGAYEAHIEALRYQKSVIEPVFTEGWEGGLAEGWEKGLADGLAEGHAEGWERGREKGLEKGREEGREEEKRHIVLNSHHAGLPVETISTITGLTLKEILLILEQSEQKNNLKK